MAEQVINNRIKSRPTGGRGILQQKLDTPVGYLLVIMLAISLGMVIGIGGLLVGAVAIGAAVGIPFIILFALNIKVGSVALFIFAFTILGVKRFIPQVPVGIVLDAVSVSLIFGVLIQLVRNRDFSILFSAVGITIGIWVIYNIIQVLNPVAASRMAWLYTVRSFALITLFYYVIAYALDDIRFVYIMIGTWLIIAFLGSLYAYNQEYVGLRGFEFAWLAADEDLFNRLLQLGVIRKWSFFSGPEVFGFVMSYSAIVCAVLALGPYPKWLRIILLIVTIPFLHSMLFSGTRAAYLLPPVAGVFYILTRLSLKSVVAGAILGAGLLFLINLPTDNTLIVRFQSAFAPEDDASFEVRQVNLAFIKPFIQSNPLGGGLGSTGIWGQRFSPQSPLSQFPPDSGFVRIAVEVGWIGLIIFTAFLLTTVYFGIRHYFLMRDPVLKNIQLTMLLVVIALIVANFPQEAITSPPNNVVFLFAVAVIANLYRMDKNYGGVPVIGTEPTAKVPSVVGSPNVGMPPDSMYDEETLNKLSEPVPTFSVEPDTTEKKTYKREQ